MRVITRSGRLIKRDVVRRLFIWNGLHRMTVYSRGIVRRGSLSRRVDSRKMFIRNGLCKMTVYSRRLVQRESLSKRAEFEKAFVQSKEKLPRQPKVSMEGPELGARRRINGRVSLTFQGQQAPA
jgi:hypothetical protein